MTIETRPRQRGRRRREPTPVGRVELELTDLAHGGEAIGRLDGRVVFVPYGLPGELVQIDLYEDKRDYARGEIVQLLRPSADRVEPPCPYFRAACGGCQWQHASYDAQLRFKRNVVAEQLRRLGGFEHADRYVQLTIGMRDPWHYRNHARFSVGRRDGELCFTRRGTRRLMRIDHCWIMEPRINDLLGRLQGKFVGFRAHQLSIRIGSNTGDLIVSPAAPQVPEIESGQDAMYEELLGRRYRVAAPAFFQVNTRREQREPPSSTKRLADLASSNGLAMAEILALVALARLDPQPEDVIVDAYCGVGTFAALIAPLVGTAVGIEESTAAVADARENARDLPNARFIAGKTEDVLPKLEERPNKALLDPARVGCDRAVLDALIEARLERIVYVSCEPATLARDLAILRDGGYTLHSVQPIDMFPQTYHVESVTLLTR